MLDLSAMKRSILILIIFISACGLPKINYLYKSDSPFSVALIQASPVIGISILGDSIPGLYEVMIEDIDLYAGKACTYRDLSGNLSLSPDRTRITNVNKLKEAFPDLPYIVVVWQDEPVISHHHSKVTEEKEEPYYPHKKREEEYELYTTYYSVKSEAMLFDLTNERLLAKSATIFHQVAAYREKDVFPSHTALGTIEDILDAGEPGKEESKKFPLIEKVDANITKGYFFRFLKGL